MSNNTEKFTYTRAKLVKVLMAAYDQGFRDGTEKRKSLDRLEFIADHEIGHSKVQGELKAADHWYKKEKKNG